MNGGHCHCYNALYLDNDTAVAGSLDLDEHAFVAHELATGDAHTGALGKVEFLGCEIEQLLVAGAGDGDELFHLGEGDCDFFVAACIDHVLQERYLGFHLLKARGCGIHEN